jgi:predicted Zn-dependent protease
VIESVARAGRARWRSWEMFFCTVSLVAFLSAAGCDMQSPVEGGGRGEGPGHRPQVLALKPEEELEVGREAYRKVLQEVRGRVLPDDAPEVRHVRQVVERIVKAAAIELLQREINLNVRGYHFDWTVNVVRDKQINAFCLPAGKMIVFTGILRVAENEDQLATVLGHEMAHALAHHGSERVAREQQQGKGGLALLTGMSYDRMQESEADHIGLFLMTFAGYEPLQAVRFWMRMAQAAGGAPPEFLSDHPSAEHRIRDLRRWAPQAKAAKQAFEAGRVAPTQKR